MTVGNESAAQWRVIDDARILAGSTHRPHKKITELTVETFQRDGVVLLPKAFPSWIEALRDGLERNLNNPNLYAFPCDSTRPSERGRFFDSYCNWQLIPEYLLFVLTSDAASIAAQLMRSNTAQFFHDHAFTKEQGTEKATPWHHDLPYYCVDGSQTVSIYVALDSIPPQTAVRFVKGSHRNGDTYRPRNSRPVTSTPNRTRHFSQFPTSTLVRPTFSLKRLNPETLCVLTFEPSTGPPAKRQPTGDARSRRDG